MFDIIIMNKVLRGTLIQRPESIPQPTLMPRKERMWHAENFGNISNVSQGLSATKKAANSEEAKIAGGIAKETGKEILKIVKEGVKILMSSTAGIAIFSGIILAMEKKLSPEQLFKTTRMVFLITTAVSFGGAIVTYLMTIGKKTSEADATEDKAAEEEKAASAEMDKAIAASMDSETVDEASSTVPDSVKEGVSETSSVIEESVITSQ